MARPTPQGPPPRAHDRDAVRTAFFRVFPGVMLAMFLAAVDQTILASALPAIVASFGGFADLSWVVTAYLLAATVAAPFYGRIGDRLGRRTTLLAALAVFTLASAACAAASTLGGLILARAVQGLGGGGLMTLSQALIGENVSPRERIRYQGYIAAVFATSSTAGPLLGALLTEHLTWRAVFLINLPLGVVALLLALRIPVHRPSPRGAFRIDIAGASLFAGAIVSLLFALSSAGNRFALGDLRLYLVLAFAGVCLASLAAWTTRSADPFIPLRLIALPAIWRSNLVVACFAAALFGAVLYLPLYLQLGRGLGIGVSGWLLLPITLSLATTSAIIGRRISRTGNLTAYPKLGLAVSTLAFAALAASVASAPTAVVLALTMIAGAGLGTTMPPTQIIVQSAAGPASLGQAVATLSVSRSVGGAAGVAIVGGILFLLVGRDDARLAAVLQHVTESGGTSLATMLDAQREALAVQTEHAFRIVFVVLACATGVGAYAASKVPPLRL
jgi:EmrB/QacA subfamily drug resistance transporter